MKYDAIKTILENLNATEDITSSAVVSVDGLPIVSALRAGIDEDRIGAMSAAILSLGSRASKEVLEGRLDHAIIHANNGYMLLFEVNDFILLAISTTEDAKLGLVLYEAKRAIKEIATEF
ncbi:roadblock/LC7 domain-containing protein [Stenoxybacter acetivorans]|uniref:roadblock/LC7 domain-containing protein n=1 Tax=Stenoxybacter acetivorans TaxID=422441 RepID=UPI0005610E46|nr:roadblock/LC7 domain-containing protein [Stenoxybacter acetivorans]